MKHTKNRQTRKPGQRVHVVTRSENRINKTEWSPRDQPVPKPITMPAIPGRNITDADMGLPEDPVAQVVAETFLSAWIGWNMKQDAKATLENWRRSQVEAVEIPLADDSLSISAVPADVLDGIASELRRISQHNHKKRNGHASHNQRLYARV